MYEERNPIKSTNMIGLLTCERMWEPTFHSCTSSSSEGGRMRDLVHLCEVIMKRLSTLFLSVRKNTLQLELKNNIVDNECWISTWYSKRFRTNLFFKKSYKKKNGGDVSTQIHSFSPLRDKEWFSRVLRTDSCTSLLSSSFFRLMSHQMESKF